MTIRKPLVLALVVPGLLLLGFLSTCGGGGNDGPVDGERAFAHVKTMVGHGPRPPNSPAIARTQAYIRQEIKKLGLEHHTDRSRVVTSRGPYVFENIWTEIPGRDPTNGPILLLAAHYDTKLCVGHPQEEHNFEFVGAIDGGGASGLLLELLRHLKDRANVPNIWVVWFDGEESIPWQWPEKETPMDAPEYEALYGSRHFAARLDSDKERFPRGMAHRLKAMVLLDLIGSKNQKIDKDVESHSELLEIFRETAAAMGESERMFAHQSPMIDDHLPFKNLGVMVIDLIDFHFRIPGRESDPRYEQWWHTEKDDLEAMDPASLAFVGNLVWNALPRLEQRIYGAKEKPQGEVR